MSTLIARPAVVRQAIERTKQHIHHLRRIRDAPSNSALVEHEEAILRKLEKLIGSES